MADATQKTGHSSTNSGTSPPTYLLNLVGTDEESSFRMKLDTADLSRTRQPRTSRPRFACSKTLWRCGPATTNYPFSGLQAEVASRGYATILHPGPTQPLLPPHPKLVNSNESDVGTLLGRKGPPKRECWPG